MYNVFKVNLKLEEEEVKTMSILEEVKTIIVEIKDIPIETIKPESRLNEDLEADSLDIVEMLMSIEEKYDIKIPEEAADHIKTVQDAIDYIEKGSES
jgi:acyl carrier protein